MACSGQRDCYQACSQMRDEKPYVLHATELVIQGATAARWLQSRRRRIQTDWHQYLTQYPVRLTLCGGLLASYGDWVYLGLSAPRHGRRPAWKRKSAGALHVAYQYNHYKQPVCMRHVKPTRTFARSALCRRCSRLC